MAQNSVDTEVIKALGDSVVQNNRALTMNEMLLLLKKKYPNCEVEEKKTEFVFKSLGGKTCIQVKKSSSISVRVNSLNENMFVVRPYSPNTFYRGLVVMNIINYIILPPMLLLYPFARNIKKGLKCFEDEVKMFIRGQIESR